MLHCCHTTITWMTSFIPGDINIILIIITSYYMYIITILYIITIIHYSRCYDWLLDCWCGGPIVCAPRWGQGVGLACLLSHTGESGDLTRLTRPACIWSHTCTKTRPPAFANVLDYDFLKASFLFSFDVQSLGIGPGRGRSRCCCCMCLSLCGVGRGGEGCVCVCV